MFVKVNGFGDHTVLVTELQIDDLGSVIPIRDLELRLPISDKIITKILKMSKYALFLRKIILMIMKVQ